MKKIVLSLIAMSMLLTNVAFASSKTTDMNTVKNSVVSNVNASSTIHLDTQDPH